MSYFEALAQAMQVLLTFQYVFLLFVGIFVGAIVGFLPGLGGVVGMAVLLPFLWDKNPNLIPPILMGMMGIMRTIDTIPAVMFAMPGTAGCQATVLDGYAMAKKGEAGRALGAAFFSSMIGGLIGSIALLLSVPIARPLIMACGSPEFFMFSMLGVTMVGVLSGSRPLKGITIGLLGMLLATIGGAPGVATLRYTFDIPYLFNGIPLVIVAMGIFAIPEMVDVAVSGDSISQVPRLTRGVLHGCRDAFRHTWLIIRCSVLGTYIGFLPGLGAAPANWIAYGHAVQSAKDKSKFGKGDIRGVIAPEAANNAADGGAIIPSLLLGIPGSPTMALFVGTLMIIGVDPGPNMVRLHLDFILLIAFSLTIANVIGASLCAIFAKPISRITTVPIHLLMPFLLMAIIIAAYQSTRHWGDLIALLLLCILGYFMKLARWPRPPLLIGFVLGSIAEKYLWISTMRYDAGWLLHPSVLAIGAVIIASFLFGLRGKKKYSKLEKS